MKINFYAPINGLGYGIHSYNLISEFEKLGHKITLIPPFNRVSRNAPDIDRWLENRNNFERTNPAIMIFNEEYLTQFTGRPRIGFPVFETEKFTPLQLACIKSCEHVLTPTQWGKKVLMDNGVKNVYVVNEGYSKDFLRINVTGVDPMNSVSEAMNEPFTFVHVGKFEARKGTLQAIECFANALEGESARLFMHITNPFTRDYVPVTELITRLGFISVNKGETWRRGGLSIHFSKPMETQAELAYLYMRADCGLYPTRAEGWGLPILETLVCRAPCIVGNWTGQSEYISGAHEMSDFILKDYKREPAIDSMFFNGDRGDWFVPSNSEIIEKIKFAFLNARAFRKSPAWRAAYEYFLQFTWKSAAGILDKVLREDILGV